LSGTSQRALNKRMIEFVILVGAVLIFLAAIGFGFTQNLVIKLVFILWGAFLIVMAIAAMHWWGRGIFRERLS
jgi:hypothetical protein